jgi:hypothetical protein
VREGKKRRRREIANVWGEDEEIVFYCVYDVVIVPSVCERGDDIVEYGSNEWMRFEWNG